jgi:hypothetical protein
MKRYKIIIPAYTRVEEIHYVLSENEDEARALALEREPDETVEDADYYVVRLDSVRVMAAEKDVVHSPIQ